MQPTANKEYLWRPKNREELSDKLKAAKKAKGITYAQLAEKVGVSKAWLACAIDGQQWVPDEFAAKIDAELGVTGADVAFMKEHPVVYPIALVDVYDPPKDFETPRGLPMTYIIAPDGTVAKQYTGPVTARMIEQDIAKAGGPAAG